MFYVDDLITQLKHYGGYEPMAVISVGHSLIGFIMFADDLLLFSPSVIGLQSMLDTCSVWWFA
jgi:hypothetical protein